MAITTEEKLLRDALRASELTAASEHAMRRRRRSADQRQQMGRAVARSTAEAQWRCLQDLQEQRDLQAATIESALEQVREHQLRLVALNDNTFKELLLWRPLQGLRELRAKILARARWQRALEMLSLFKSCCIASGTSAFDLYFPHAKRCRFGFPGMAYVQASRAAGRGQLHLHTPVGFSE